METSGSESTKTFGVREEVWRSEDTSTPLPARLILVTKPNPHVETARKKARIVTCDVLQNEVNPFD